jgi:hypothetical protein
VNRLHVNKTGTLKNQLRKETLMKKQLLHINLTGLIHAFSGTVMRKTGVKTNRFLKTINLITIAGYMICGLTQFVFAQGPGPSWPYYRTISLSPATPSANFQVKVTLSAGQYTNMKSDGSDILFYDNNNVNCQYWIELWNTGGTSSIWVKVATSGSSSLLMYYGNSSQTATTNGITTFDFFDDFPGTSLDPSWSSSGTGTKTVLNSQVSISNDILISHSFIPSSTSFLFETKHHESAYHRNRFYAASTLLGFSPTGFDIGYFSDGTPQIFWNGWTGVGVTLNTEYMTQWRITDGSTYNWYLYNYTSGALLNSQGTTVTSNIRYITFGATEGGSTTIIDWVRVRKYAASEPVATVGAQQTLSVCGFGNNANSSITATPCINMPTNSQTAATIAAHQYFVMNVIQGINYIVKTCSSPTIGNALQLAVYNESTGNQIAWSQSNSGNTCGNAYDAYLTFTPAFSGQVRVLLNNRGDCSSTLPAGIAVLVDIPGGSNTLDVQTTAATDAWTGHIYDATNAGVLYNGTFSNYLGYYAQTETFNETFGNASTDTYCYNVVQSAGTVRASVENVTFSVRYRMSSTKHGLYVVDIGSDDGSRLAIDGTLIYNNWSDQAYSSKPRVLMSLAGSSNLVLDYYESGGGNQLTFQTLTLVLANNLSSNLTQNLCIGNSGSAISGDTYGTLPTGISLSGTGYQWVYGSSSSGPWTNISGATGATYIPSTSAAPFNVTGTYYIRRNATLLSAANNTGVANYIATNLSGNYATLTVDGITATAPTTISGTTAICTGGSTTLTASGGTGGTSSNLNWFSDACESAFTQEWFIQPYTMVNMTLNSVNGILNVTSTTIDPMIVMYPIGSFNPVTYKYIRIRYRVVSGTAGYTEIFYTNARSAVATGDQMVNGALISDGAWHIINIDMSVGTYWYNSNVTGWRFDWCTNNGVTMEIDYISLGAGLAVGQGTSITVSPAATTNYFVLRSGCNITGCASTTVTVAADPSAPSATKSPNTVSACAGVSLTLTNPVFGSGGTGTCNIEYATSTDGGVSYSAFSTTVPTITATGTDNRIKIRTNCNGPGCDISPEVVYTWTVNALPAFTTLVIADVSCYGGNDGRIRVTITGGVDNSPYSFSINNGTDNYTQAYTGSFPNYVLTGLLANITYKIRVKDKNGCESAFCTTP